MPRNQKRPAPRPGAVPRLSSVYSGREDGDEIVVTADGAELDHRFDIVRHSPDGFSWGYGGSGPAQLALAILCDFLGDDAAAQRLYQDFKFEVVARWPQGVPWTITGQQISETKTLRESLVRGVHDS